MATRADLKAELSRQCDAICGTETTDEDVEKVMEGAEWALSLGPSPMPLNNPSVSVTAMEVLVSEGKARVAKRTKKSVIYEAVTA